MDRAPGFAAGGAAVAGATRLRKRRLEELHHGSCIAGSGAWLVASRLAARHRALTRRVGRAGSVAEKGSQVGVAPMPGHVQRRTVRRHGVDGCTGIDQQAGDGQVAGVVTRYRNPAYGSLVISVHNVSIAGAARALRSNYLFIGGADRSGEI